MIPSARPMSDRNALVISDLELYLVQIEALGPHPPVRCLVVRLATNAGREGWGEAAVPWRAEELPARRNALLPALAGQSVYDIEELLGMAPVRTSPLRSALEMACWDAIGRAAGQPLHRLLGGAYRRRIPIAVRLAGDNCRQVAQSAGELAEQGYHCQVVSSSGRPQEDLEIIASVRDLVPDRTELRLDAACGYDADTAAELCQRLEGARLQCIVDPLAGVSLDRLAALRRQTTVPLAAWRPLHGPADVLAVVRAGAAPMVVIELQRVGGITQARKGAAVAEAAGLATALAVGPSLGIGLAAMLQVAAATPALAAPHECAPHHLADDLLVEPIEVVDGMIALSEGPGLGMEIDRAKIERYQVT